MYHKEGCDHVCARYYKWMLRASLCLFLAFYHIDIVKRRIDTPAPIAFDHCAMRCLNVGRSSDDISITDS
jgi:hypothetical protein